MGEKIYKKYATFTKPLHSVKTDLKIKRYWFTKTGLLILLIIFLASLNNELNQESI